MEVHYEDPPAPLLSMGAARSLQWAWGLDDSLAKTVAWTTDASGTCLYTEYYPGFEKS